MVSELGLLGSGKKICAPNAQRGPTTIGMWAPV